MAEPVSNNSVLIVGGSFRKIDGVCYTQKRQWDMLTIFSDQFKQATFAMREVPTDESHSHAMSDDSEVVAFQSNLSTKGVIKNLFSNILTTEEKTAIENAGLIYLRLPLWSCWTAFKYAKRLNKPIICSVHGNWSEVYREKESTGLTRLANLLLAMYSEHATKAIINESKAVFFVGDALRDLYGGLATEYISYANFLHSSEDVVHPDSPAIADPDSPKLLYVGALEERKGLIYLLQAIADLKGKGIVTTLNIVGNGGQESALRTLAQTLSIEGQINFLGYMQHGDELSAVYNKADIFILPSISSEGMPKVIVEAMVQAIPVVATDIGGVKYILNHGERGMLVEPKSAQALAEGIEKLIADQALYKEYVKQGIDYALASTKEKQIAKVIALLKRTCGEWARPLN